jgi:hypothetical protein
MAFFSRADLNSETIVVGVVLILINPKPIKKMIFNAIDIVFSLSVFKNGN